MLKSHNIKLIDAKKTTVFTYLSQKCCLLIETASQTTSISTRNCAIMRIPIPPTLNRISKAYMIKNAKNKVQYVFISFFAVTKNTQSNPAIMTVLYGVI